MSATAKARQRYREGTASGFRAIVDLLGYTQIGLAEQMKELGDTREIPTILRSINNWCRGEYAVPGEMWVVLRLLAERGGRVREQR
jgi:hypothetical protein